MLYMRAFFTVPNGSTSCRKIRTHNQFTIIFVCRFLKGLDYVDPAKAAIWGWVKLVFFNFSNISFSSAG